MKCQIKAIKITALTRRMKKIWDEIGAFPVTEQGLADRARQIQTNKWLADIEIEELERNWNKKIVQWKFRRMTWK